MTRFFKWLGNLFHGRRRLLEKVAEGVRSIEISVDLQTESIISIIDTTKAVLGAASANLSTAQQALVRSLGAFERSDATFEKIGRLADKMAAREAALEEALISIGKLKVEEAKKLSVETEEKKKDVEASEYDKKF